ncbi:hypothetical protein [Granulicella aggregans]|uniref:hypothetical protein n=1 Tax=Granulicella aggregans TaxID=474949 RepID=UPI0021DF6259|nr:hypothetical protein [Granulicella aggregans]
MIDKFDLLTREHAPPSKLEILGVYRPFIRKATYKQQWRVTGSDELTAAHFKDLVLIEALVHRPDESFRQMKEIGQIYLKGKDQRFPHNFQVPWDEALLSFDGMILIQRRRRCVYGTGTLRFAFYLHFYDPTRTLETPYGPIMCPPIADAPQRLMRLVPYNACC